jgi:fibro-slime domain-containing protein
MYMSKKTYDPFCGIMIRNSLKASSKSASVIRPYTSANLVSMKTRGDDGASIIDVTMNPTTFSSWIRLKKTGNIFISYRSDNGSVWKVVGKDTITMNDTVFAGLIACSGSESELSTIILADLRGMIRRSYSDSLIFSIADNTYIKYTVNEISQDLFSMKTEAYKKKINGEKVYITDLTQSLSRKRNRSFVSTAVDSAYIPVTYYDFRANNSNPEFNVYHTSAKGMKNMIQKTLDSDRKPVPTTFSSSEQPRSCFLYCYSGNGNAWYSFPASTRISKITNNIFDSSCQTYCVKTHLPGYPNQTVKSWWFSDSLRLWFRPSDAPGAEFDPYSGRWNNLKNKPLSSGGSAPNEWVGQNYNQNNQFASIVMYDSLKFRERPSGSGIFVFGDSLFSTTVDTQYYVFGCSDKKSKYKFMPLKKKGFGFDPTFYSAPSTYCSSVENFSFSMEMHKVFTYKSGQKFTFRGDDDVWVFVNNRLVIDLGGIHNELSATVDLDTLELVEGEQYWFDFFYCERFVSESNIYITTNMQMFVPPQSNKRSWKRDYGDLD